MEDEKYKEYEEMDEHLDMESTPPGCYITLGLFLLALVLIVSKCHWT